MIPKFDVYSPIAVYHCHSHGIIIVIRIVSSLSLGAGSRNAGWPIPQMTAISRHFRYDLEEIYMHDRDLENLTQHSFKPVI